MKVWPYEVVQVKRGSVEARNPCATVAEARARAGRTWDAIVRNRAVSEWHPDVPREARRAVEAWLVRRDPPVPLGEVEDAPPPVVPIARRAVEALAEEPEAPAYGLAFIQPEGVCVVCGDTPQRHRPTLPEALRPLCKRHRMRAQVLRSQGGLTPEAAVAALGVVLRADAPPSKVIEVPRVPPTEPLYTPAPVEEVVENLPEETSVEVYPPATCTLDPSGGLPGDGLVRVFLGPRSVGAPVWGRHVAPGVVEVTGVRLSVEHAL